MPDIKDTLNTIDPSMQNDMYRYSTCYDNSNQGLGGFGCTVLDNIHENYDGEVAATGGDGMK